MAIIPWLKGIFQPKDDRQLTTPIDEQLAFMPSRHLTLGVEFEVGVMDAETFHAHPIARELIAGLGGGAFHGEAGNHVLEMVTGVCETLQQAETDLQGSLAAVSASAAQQGLALTGTGIVLLYTDREFGTDENNPRYIFLRERRQLLFDQFNSMQGMHMHFGMRSADDCIRYNNFFIHFLPHLLAMSAATPFYGGQDTGMATYRPVVSEAMPFAGLPYPFINWDDYKNLCRVMAKADAIRNLKDLWWDLRPSPRFGTLEIRVCDQPATLAEGMAIVAFMHLLAFWFEEHHGWLDEMPRPSAWRLRENKWRAIRYGLDAELVVNNQGETRNLKTDILLWLERVAPYTARMKYEPYVETLRQMLARGNSSERQRRLFAATGNLRTVADFNMRELQAGAPLWDELDRIAPLQAPGATTRPADAPISIPLVSAL